jgi:hypothetical protein
MDAARDEGVTPRRHNGPMTIAAAPRLSKSRFVSGVQCHKLLWLKVHEPDAPELVPDRVLQDRFEQGIEVGRLARERFPGGVLIDLPHHAIEERLDATRRALHAGGPAVFEATFVEDGVFVAVDVLERLPHGDRLIEVKSSTGQRPEQVVDAAVQVHVLRRAGVDVRAVEIMHLNPEYRHPDVGDLFARADVTEAVANVLAGVPGEIAGQLEMLGGPLPEPAIGTHCMTPHACPFRARCWPDDPDHIGHLYSVRTARVAELMERGVHRIQDVPPDERLHPAARRQLRSVTENRLVVEPGLAAALEPFREPIGFLDFETVGRAIPVWPGLGPWHAAPVQFSYHELSADGSCPHIEHLAEGPNDPRPGLARQLVEATRGARCVVTYSAFERRCIRQLQGVVPHLRAELQALDDKLLDLLPVVRNFIYHPDFRGSFSVKHVLRPLAGELGYDDLEIADGMLASVEIARLLFTGHTVPEDERRRLRTGLLAYCKRDTEAMVVLLARLRELGHGPLAQAPDGGGMRG